MARISNYKQDENISSKDRVLGSSYEGEGQSGPIYKTRTYSLTDLGDYFSNFIQTGSGSIDVNLLAQYIDENTQAIATANQSLSVIANNQLAQATFQTNLAASFGTYDANGNLTSISQAHADQVLQATASDRYANAQFVTNLAASVGAYDENGNLVTLSEGFANQVLSTTTTDRFATSTFATNLAASFGTYNPDGTLATISESFANQLLQASTSSDFADAQFVTNLMSNFGTFDENGNILTISTSYADQLLQTANTAEFAQASFATNLASSFGTYNPDGSIATFSQSFADQVLSTANTSDLASASFVTNLATSLGTYDANGNLLTISSSFADDVLSTANTSEFAEASKLTALGASFGTVNPDGSVSFSNTSTYSSAILNYVDNSSSLATQVSNLQTTVTNIPQTIRQDDPPAILDGNNDLIYPLGSIWIDTNDANAIYILIEDAGDPIGYAWSPTTSEALGDLILSNAALQDEVTLLSTNLSSEATKLTTLTAQFGIYDPATNTFTIDNNAAVVSDLRTYADAESAAASKVDGINSVLNMVDASGNVIKNEATFLQEIRTDVDANSATAAKIDGLNSVFNIVDASGNVIKNLATFNQEITTYVDANSATAQAVDALEITIGDENSGLVANVTATSTAVGNLEDGLQGSYALTVGAGNAISSMTLLAEDPLQPGLPPTSSIVFNTGEFKIQNGNGVDQFTINTITGKAEFSGHLQAATGSFSGTLQAGGVSITNDTITLTQLPTFDVSSNIIFNNSSGSQVGEIKVIDIGISPIMFITAANGLTVNTNTSNYSLSNSFEANGNGVATSTAKIRDFLTVRLEETSGNSVYLDAAGVYLATSNGTFFFVQDNVISCGNATSDVIFNVNGAPVSGGGSTTDTNYYLQGVSINNTNGVLTFDVNGAYSNPTVSIATYVSNRLASYMPLSGGTFSGSVSATDFILTNSDISLKENIELYQPKPINIQYKEYNLKSNGEKRLGVIAQELEADHPEFVKEDGNGIKSVSYIEMLIAKVAELEARIKELEHGSRK